MASANTILCIMSFSLFFLFTNGVTANSISEEHLASCLAAKAVKNFTDSHSINFDSLLKFSIQNLRFARSNGLKPSFLIFPDINQEVQAAVACCLKDGFEIRVRSGGHSYEGLSFTAEAPFVIIDLMNLNAVRVHVPTATAWVEAGATLGEIYYTIAKATGRYGFSAGVCPTVGSGGHISGGGEGVMSRKYGLAADNVVDAVVVDAEGRLLDRRSMGEDLFWALRGGGGGSWGIVVAWKIKLLKVPSTVTLLNITRSGLHSVTELVYKWQTVAPNLEKDFYLPVFLATPNNATISATFIAVYLGPRTGMLKSIASSFPELEIKSEDCKEMKWIEAVTIYLSGLGSNITRLLHRDDWNKVYFYAKSDYVRSPIPKSAIRGACKKLQQQPNAYTLLYPYGGKMAEIPWDSIPFPHRAGNLFHMDYQVRWKEDTGDNEAYIEWLRELYSYMEPYVSRNPRAAYVNVLDLDLGSFKSFSNSTSLVAKASNWGKKYFMNNYERLVQVKTRVDPHNVFRNAQSIPPAVHI